MAHQNYFFKFSKLINPSVKLCFLLLFVIVTLCNVTKVNAYPYSAELGTGFLGAWGTRWDDLNTAVFTVSIGGDPMGNGKSDIFSLTQNDVIVGQPIFLTSGIIFDTAVDLLTNGNNDHIAWGFPNYGGQQFNESWLFFGDYTGKSGVDFNGLIVKGISLTFSEFTVIQSGDWIAYNINSMLTIDVEPNSAQNSVPEPATMLLMVAGLSGLIGVSRKKK